ncbi:MAG TPA: universal stress protein [Steroidobacteraceae bacterium]
MIKTIFVPVSGSDTDARVFATALAIARPFGAHLRFYHLHLSAGEAAARAPQVDHAMGQALASSLEYLRSQADALSVSALAHYKEFCELNEVRMRSEPTSSGPVSASWTQETRGAMERLMFHARHSDVVVLGRPRNRDFMPVGIIESLLMGSGRPIVLAPDNATPQAINTIVVGWKETPEASRAMAAAVPLLEEAERVVLLSMAEEGAAPTEALEDLARQLAWHGVSAQVHVTVERSGPARHQLRRVATQLEADLLVVGGFGHGQFRERMFGGVTQALIDEAMVPVFMAH